MEVESSVTELLTPFISLFQFPCQFICLWLLTFSCHLNVSDMFCFSFLSCPRTWSRIKRRTWRQRRWLEKRRWWCWWQPRRPLWWWRSAIISSVILCYVNNWNTIFQRRLKMYGAVLVMCKIPNDVNFVVTVSDLILKMILNFVFLISNHCDIQSRNFSFYPSLLIRLHSF